MNMRTAIRKLNNYLIDFGFRINIKRVKDRMKRDIAVISRVT
jgi:hypothetical protein